MTKKKSVLFIAGGEWQVPFVNFLKKKGFHITLVDPYEDSQCVELADEFIQLDVKSIDLIYEKIKDNELDYVLSDQTDVAVNPVAVLSEKLGLSINSVLSTQLFSNKSKSRSFVQSFAGEIIPGFKVITSVTELSAFVDEFKDVIIKPTDAQSSRGVNRVENKEYLEFYFNEAKNASPSHSVIVEEFLIGEEITVEGICLNSKHRTLTTSSKKHIKTGIASDLIYPSNIKTELLKKIYDFNDEYVDKSGLSSGVTHAEYIVDQTNNKFWLVEIACRGGGSLIPSDIVPWVTGIDVYEHLFDAISGENKLNIGDILSKSAILHFFNFKNGLVKQINGLEEIEKIPEVLTCRLSFSAGDEIFDVSDDRGRHGFVIVLSENELGLTNTLKEVYNKIAITYEV